MSLSTDASLREQIVIRIQSDLQVKPPQLKLRNGPKAIEWIQRYCTSIINRNHPELPRDIAINKCFEIYVKAMISTACQSILEGYNELKRRIQKDPNQPVAVIINHKIIRVDLDSVQKKIELLTALTKEPLNLITYRPIS